jgi:hypothetical protein
MGCSSCVAANGCDAADDAVAHVGFVCPPENVGIMANWSAGFPILDPGSLFQVGLTDPTSVIAGNYSAIVGGQGNTVDASTHSFIGGGLNNVIDPSAYSGIIGGQANAINSNSGSVVLGGNANTIDADYDNNAIVAGEHNTVSLGGASGFFRGHSGIFGGQNNLVETHNSVIAGGSFHSILFAGGPFGGHSAFIGGGFRNSIGAGSERSAMLGGQDNIMSGTNDSFMLTEFSTMTGSNGNNGIFAGSGHTKTGGTNSAILAGTGHMQTAGLRSAIIAGTGHTMSADNSVIAGGGSSIASHSSSFMCGSAPITTGVRTFAHGLGAADPVGFRGAVPIPAPVLAAIPAPTGIAGLDAWIASVDAALKLQGFAV